MVDLIDVVEDLPQAKEGQQGGIAQHIYYAFQEDFKKNGIAQLPNPSQSIVDFVDITDNHSLKSGRHWKKVYTTLQKGNYATEVVGEPDSRIIKVTTTIFHPNKTSKALATFNKLLDRNLIVLVPLPGEDCNNVEYLQMGDGCLWAKAMPAFNTGEGPEGERGTTVTIESYHLRKYLGDIITSSDVDSSDSAS